MIVWQRSGMVLFWIAVSYAHKHVPIATCHLPKFAVWLCVFLVRPSSNAVIYIQMTMLGQITRPIQQIVNTYIHRVVFPRIWSSLQTLNQLSRFLPRDAMHSAVWQVVRPSVDSAPSLGVYYFLSLTLSVCLVLHVALYKTLFFDFWFRPLIPKIYSPKFGSKSPISRVV